MHILSGQKIIFLPGIDGTGISFEPFRSELPEDIQALVIQYPADTLLSFDDTVRCAREQIQAGDDALVIAESFSGPVAIELIGSGAIRAKGVVLSATFARSPRPFLLKLANVLPAEFFVSLPAPKAIMRHVLNGGEPTAEIFISLLRRIRKIVPARTIVHRLKVVDGVDVRRWLPQILIPCLYLQSAADLTVPSRCLADFADLVPDLRVRRLQGPHFLLQAQPRASIAAICQFVASAGLVCRR